MLHSQATGLQSSVEIITHGKRKPYVRFATHSTVTFLTECSLCADIISTELHEI